MYSRYNPRRSGDDYGINYMPQIQSGTQYIPQVDPNFINMMANTIDKKSQRFDLSNELFSRALEEFGSIPMPQADAQGITESLSNLDENVRAQVRDKYGNDYGAAFNDIRRMVSSFRPVMGQITQAAKEEESRKALYDQLAAKNTLLRKRRVGTDPETGEPTYEEINPFAEPMFSVVDGHLKMTNPRDYSNIMEQTDYRNWAENISDTLSKNIRESFLHQITGSDGTVDDRFLKNLSISGYTAAELDRMIKEGKLLAEGTVDDFINSTTWGVEHGTDEISKRMAKEYLTERIKEQVIHQTRGSLVSNPDYINAKERASMAADDMPLPMLNPNPDEEVVVTPGEIADLKDDGLYNNDGSLKTVRDLKEDVPGMVPDIFKMLGVKAFRRYFTNLDAKRVGKLLTYENWGDDQVRVNEIRKRYDEFDPEINIPKSRYRELVESISEGSRELAGKLSLNKGSLLDLYSRHGLPVGRKGALGMLRGDPNIEAERVRYAFQEADPKLQKEFFKLAKTKYFDIAIDNRAKKADKASEVIKTLREANPELSYMNDEQLMSSYAENQGSVQAPKTLYYTLTDPYQEAVKNQLLKSFASTSFNSPSLKDDKSVEAVTRAIGGRRADLQTFRAVIQDPNIYSSIAWDTSTGSFRISLPVFDGNIPIKGDGQGIDWSKASVDGYKYETFTFSLGVGTKPIQKVAENARTIVMGTPPKRIEFSKSLPAQQLPLGQYDPETKSTVSLGNYNGRLIGSIPTAVGRLHFYILEEAINSMNNLEFDRFKNPVFAMIGDNGSVAIPVSYDYLTTRLLPGYAQEYMQSTAGLQLPEKDFFTKSTLSR